MLGIGPSILSTGIIFAYFLMSLCAAVILFKFLDSRAVIRTDGGKFGGALAGFVGVFGVLFGAHTQLVENVPDVEPLELTKPETFLGYADEQHGFAIAYPNRFSSKPWGAKIVRATFVDTDLTDNRITVYTERMSDATQEKLLRKANGSEDEMMSNLASSLVFQSRQTSKIVSNPSIETRRTKRGDIGRLIAFEIKFRSVRFAILRFVVLKRGTASLIYVEMQNQLSEGQNVGSLRRQFEETIGSLTYR